MSRTRKTAPWSVRVMKKNYLEEHHDHRNGVCDLPPKPVGKTDPWGWNDRQSPFVKGSCTWRASMAFWVTPINNCGCPRCTDQDGRKGRNRKIRRGAARDIAEYR